MRIWNLAFQPLKTLNLYYRNVYGHQDWQKVSHSKGIPHVSKTTFSEENCPPPNSKTKPNPNSNPNHNRGATFFGDNCPDTIPHISFHYVILRDHMTN